MGRNRLDPDSETTTDGFRLSKGLKKAFYEMCDERDKDAAEIYRAMMEREIREHAARKRVRIRARRSAA